MFSFGRWVSGFWIFHHVMNIINHRVYCITKLQVICYCPQANGRACVDFGCTHPIDGLF